MRKTAWLGFIAVATALSGLGCGSSDEGGASNFVAEEGGGETGPGSGSGGGGVGSSASAEPSGGTGGGASDVGTGTSAATGASSGGEAGEGTTSVSSGQGGGGPQPGTLTAGDWDDNLNFGFFQSYLTHFSGLYPGMPKIHSADRVVITVETEAGEPVSNALVKVGNEQMTFLTVPTASDGRALFFPKHDGVPPMMQNDLKVTVAPPEGQDDVASVTVPAPDGTEWKIVLPGATKALPDALDLAFVVDATGSMGDEIDYLKAEIGGIASHVQQEFGNVSIRYALIVYRDVGDAYVTKTFDFTESLDAFQGDLSKQSADGGGDYPEAMDAAVEEMNLLSWRTGNVARVAFLVADAPPHPENGHALLQHANVARLQGIKLYPVAASGVGDEAEYYMRVAAQACLGRYLFLTDDSGVGDPHAEPHIPCYQVQHLNALMTRMIASELTGTRVPADPADVIKTVGNPQGNACTLADGTTVYF